MTAASQHQPGALHPGREVVQRPMLALGLRLGSALMFSVMLLLVKLTADRGVWFPETLVWRQAVPTVLLFAWLAARGQLHRLHTARPWIHARRAVIGTVGMFMTLGVVLLLPLAEATVLGFTAPLFAVGLSVLLLGERVGMWRVGAVLLGLVGVVIMASPAHAHFPLAGLAVGIGAAFMISLVSIQLRDLGRTEEPVTIVFYFSAMSVPMLALALPFAPGDHDQPFHHGLITWLMIGGIGVFGLATQLLMTAALRYGRVSSVIVMDYAQFGWSLLWGWLVFGHLPAPGTWLGAPAIIASGLIIAWREQVRGGRGVAADALDAIAE
jgi:drug/metabolite transporter (DMT)-like permease